MENYKQLYKKIQKFLEQDLLNKEKLYEMANLSQDMTNLPVIVWADSARNLKHAARIKFQNSYSTKTDGSELIPMTISDNPQIPNSIKTKLRIKSKDLNKIKQWVILNKDLLEKYFKEDINTLDFITNMKKV